MNNNNFNLRKTLDDLDQTAKDMSIITDLLFDQESGNEKIDFLQEHLKIEIVCLRQKIKRALDLTSRNNDN